MCPLAPPATPQAFEATKYDSWDTVAAALRDAGGPACYARAQAAFDALQGPLSATPAGRQQLAAAMGCAARAGRWWAERSSSACTLT